MPSGAKCLIFVPSGVLGEEQTFEIAEQFPEDEGFYNVTVTYSCGDHEGTIVSKTKASEVTWTPPLEFAEANTTGGYVYATLTATTYMESEEIGTYSVNVYYTIPSSVAPTFTVDFTDESGYKEIYGDFIQMHSRLKIAVKPKEAYGASIKYYKVAVGDQTFTTQESVTGAITSFGSIPVVVSIQDTRGRLVQESFSVYFRECSLPTISSLAVKRCDVNGNENDQGEYVQVKFTASATSLNNKNTVSYQLEYKKTEDSYFTVVTLTEFTNIFYISDETYTFAADTGSSYDIQLTVTDAFCSVTKTNPASTATTIMHFKADGKGIGFGKVSEVENAVDVGWMIQMNGNRITKVGNPQEDEDAVNKKYVDAFNTVINEMTLKSYPVGAIYISTQSTSPASLFGGTWEQIQDVFLLSAGSTYIAGRTGGESEHTLTINEMPKHRHFGVTRFSYDPVSGSHPSAAETEDKSNYLYSDYAGGDSAHNNMPPYLVVYVWERVG